MKRLFLPLFVSIVVGSMIGCRKHPTPTDEQCRPWPEAPPARVLRDAQGCAIVRDPPPQHPNPDCSMLRNQEGSRHIDVDCPPALLRPGDPPPHTERPPGKESMLRRGPVVSVGLESCAVAGESFCGPAPSMECTPFDQRTIPCTVVDAGAGKSTGGLALIASFIHRDGLGRCHLAPVMMCSSGGGPCAVPDSPEVPCPNPYPTSVPPDPPHW